MLMCWRAAVHAFLVARIFQSKSSKACNCTGDVGNPTGEEAFNYTPKSFMVVGSLQEFMTDRGVNQERYRSFELYRRNTYSPEIITFDELFERARFIVAQHET